MKELQHIIEQKQELLAREAISRPAVDYSKDMTAEEQKRYINYLAERLEKADLGYVPVMQYSRISLISRRNMTSVCPSLMTYCLRCRL